MNENGLASDGQAKIWRPKVLPLDGSCFQEGKINRSANQQVFTRTYLDADKSHSTVANINQRILMASQSYNNSPKPFVSQHNLANEPLYNQSSDRSEMSKASFSCGHQQAQGCQNQQVNMDNNPSRSPSSPSKLVHNQYNSPLDLYSMNNIRKTIEAHSEMIAPGVKGVNFLKADTPVNKNSEVYRLVMEEEQKRHGQSQTGAGTSTLGPATRPPTITVSRSMDHADHQYEQRQQQQQQQHQCINSSQYQQNKLNSSYSVDVVGANELNRKKSPACMSCGNYITGVFAKIQDHYIHPHCFNCTTCGASLKNCGYFTVNDRLYCEIHAKQVAKLWRIPGFEKAQNASPEHRSPTPEPVSTSSRPTCHGCNYKHVCCHEAHNYGAGTNHHRHVGSESLGMLTKSEQQQPVCSQSMAKQQIHCNRQTTISSMFKDLNSSTRGTTQGGSKTTHNQDHAENNGANVVSSSSGRLISSKVMENGRDHRVQCTRSVIHHGPCSSTGPPVCCHCSKPIHGPYILAGKSTWCKQCSCTSFVCSSCRRSLLEVGFIEEEPNRLFCQPCYENLYAPECSRCNRKVVGECLNALGKQWHPTCFVCGHCHQPFGNSSFYLEDNVPYCERDWNQLFTTKCYACSYPIEAGDKWVEALNKNYHSGCFRCTGCEASLEGSTFYCKNGKPYCRLHQH